MKKSTLALSVIVALGAITTGGAWYTGKQAETHYKELIKQANQGLKQLKDFDLAAEIKNVKFERGLFSSDASYNIVITNLKAQESAVLNGKSEVFHGPFPLNQLKHGNIVPALLSANSHITSESESLKTIFADKEILTTDVSLGYTGTANGSVTINPIKYSSEKGTLELAKTVYQGNFSSTGDQAITLPAFKFISKEGNEFVVDGFSLTANYTNNDKYPNITGVGPFEVQIKQAKMTAASGEKIPGFTITIDYAKVKGNSSFHDNRFAMDINTDAKVGVSSQINQANLGKMQFAVKSDLDAAALNDALPYYNQSEMSPQHLDAVTAIVSNAPQLAFNLQAFENGKGKNELDFKLDLAKFQPETLKSLTDALEVINTSTLKLNLDFASMQETIKQFASISPETKDKTEEVATQAVNSIKDLVKTSEYMQLENETAKFNLAVVHGKVTLNGRELKESEVQMALFAIMLAAAGATSGH